MRRLIILMTMLTLGCGGDGGGLAPDPIPGAGDFARVLESGGRDRTYLLHAPPAVESGRRLPMIVAYHGIPSNAEEMRALTGLNAIADERGFLVAYPNAVDDWATGCIPCSFASRIRIDDVRFTRDLIERVATDAPLDRRRVFAVGFSNGALFVHRLACDATDVVAGFASVGATMIGEQFVPACERAQSRPMIFFHGSDDTSFPREGRVFELDLGTVFTLSMDDTIARWSERNDCSPDPEVTQLPDRSADGTTVTHHDYIDCAGADLAYYDVKNGGHTWPGSPVDFAKFLGAKTLDVNAGEVIADYFGIR